ncbi:hypothetical protein EHQ47_16675 [Leptospira bourretii]|uniref:hypothetical protein n=1 Tax=Leptospira bourretii TaxID=2484962 RepID=UPI0010912D17|nr:hypothetical protein [Leptospira bourretii]TGL19730.1 hypothetical protein EHQ47_16675 [Leptospira bourretii]
MKALILFSILFINIDLSSKPILIDGLNNDKEFIETNFISRLLDCIASGDRNCLDKITAQTIYIGFEDILFRFNKKITTRPKWKRSDNLYNKIGLFEDFYQIIITKTYAREYFSDTGFFEYEIENSIKDLATINRKNYYWTPNCGFNLILLVKENKKKVACVDLNNLDINPKSTIVYQCKNYEKEIDCKIVGLQFL